MSTFDSPRKLSVGYPNESQKNEAIDIMRPPGLSSQVYNRQQLHKRICEAEQDGNGRMLNTESYYKAQTKRSQPSTYDRVNHVTIGYDQKLHRDDRAFAKSHGLHVNQEEKCVSVPSLSSSIYGHPRRQPLEVIDRKHFSVQTYSLPVIPNNAQSAQSGNVSTREKQKNEFEIPKVCSSRQKWTQKVLSDVKLLWNMSVHVDIPAYEEYETMCLFDNHWSTTYEDLKLLRRNCKRGEKHLKTEFLTFGGHWNRRTNACGMEDCFFGEGHKYIP